MFTKVNVNTVIRDHLRTLHDFGEKSTSSLDIFLFYILPAVIMLGLMLGLGLRVSENLANALFTGVSIFAGLLFNVQLLVYDNVRQIQRSDKELPAQIQDRRTLFTELFSNVSYAILICLLMLVLIGLFNLTFEGRRFEWIRHTMVGGLSPINFMVQWLILTVATNFVLTLFMVLKRLHILLTNEIDLSKQ